MKIYLFIILNLILFQQLFSQSEINYLTKDGSWCWFSDPRAIIVNNFVYTGWVKTDGSIETVKLNIKNKEIQTCILYNQLEEDDHNNPSFVINKNGDIIAMYTTHAKKEMFLNILKYENKKFEFSKAKKIDPISNEELRKYPLETITYCNPWKIKNENNKLYCFGRWTGYKPNIMSSEDQGLNWSKSKVFITNNKFEINNRPYVKYFSDGKSKIHIVFTNGHPRNEPYNSVYYCFLENGKFFKANGELICDTNNIPFEPKEASVIYKANSIEGRAWIADIGQDEKGNPVVLYTKSPTENDHRYYYARYVNNKWVNYEICKSGKWFPQTPYGQKEREPHYFGGLTIDPNNCNLIFISRQINGKFEIERWETKDKGKTWDIEAITKKSKYDNVRPFIPRGLNNNIEIVLWMENQKYIHYTDFKTSIKYWIRRK